MDAEAEPAEKAERESGKVERGERTGELGSNRNALCQGSPIQEQIRVRKRKTNREEGGPGKDQEEGTSRPTLSVLKFERGDSKESPLSLCLIYSGGACRAPAMECPPKSSGEGSFDDLLVKGNCFLGGIFHAKIGSNALAGTFADSLKQFPIIVEFKDSITNLR